MATAHQHEAPVSGGHTNDDSHFFGNAVTVLEKLTAPDGLAGHTIHPTELRHAVGLVFLSWTKAGLGISGITGHGVLIKLAGGGGSAGAPATTTNGTPAAIEPTVGGAQTGGDAPTTGGAHVAGGTSTGGGKWSAPLFVKMMGASVGLSAGFESGESVIVLRTPESVDGFLKAQSMIDLDFASILPGSQRNMGADKPSIIGTGPVSQYNIASGAMVDLSLSGVKFSIDETRNHQVYGQGANPAQIISGTAPPPAAQPLLTAVEAAMHKATSWLV
jgi:lipid-binding SYLF domain-containing protein